MAGRKDELRRQLGDAGVCRSLAAAIARDARRRVRTLACEALRAGVSRPEVAQLARLSEEQLDELLAPAQKSSKPH